MTFDISKLDLFPNSPGVYLMKNAQGVVIYVGKAKNLRQRIRQYFSLTDTRPIIPHLVAKIADIDTILVSSEKEALLLERTLAKQYQPKYNALLKDDKAYIALKVNNKHPWPMVQLVRYKGRPKADGLYFGPYTSALAARETLDLIHHVFPLRECSDQELMRRTRPCILYDMKRCIAPCVKKCTKEEYEELVTRTVRFLRGQDKEILKEMYKEMEREAEELQFEKADLILKKIRQIEATLEQQKVEKPLGGNSDIFGFHRHLQEVIVVKLFIRNGKLLGSRHFDFVNTAEDDPELLTSLLLQHYSEGTDLPEEILVPIILPDAELLIEIFSEQRGSKVNLYTPQRGDKLALIEMARMNAESLFVKKKDLNAIREKTLLEMQEKFHLNNYPGRIDCFDNSHTAGQNRVSALVTFEAGAPDKSHYRKYKIKEVQDQLLDDYAMMHEVMTRRYKRAKESDELPDLVIVDGGKGHLNIALKVFAELNIITVDLIAVAKEEGRHDKGETSEQVFLPFRKDPIFLKRGSPVLFLLQQIRDEAHRFAIAFHRQQRSKKFLSSSLDAIPGIGPKKRTALLKHFGSARAVFAASREDLEKVKGLSKANIDAIIGHAEKR